MAGKFKPETKAKPTSKRPVGNRGKGLPEKGLLISMGEALSLPPFLEAKRATIEAGLKPL